ncbi:Hsp20 family protein [Ornithinibacillus sp. L9]|uniref:Hsp20 family protein n=1 Tax=Ornithinibacillus caprae TaxID=2678566 RepID=A0A6N8FQQ1_9BACI|nr:Hsp20/alpha crystallin family protein [Ornithinibacillus caprae]MUK90419.1 Hsp20 family protein [Ornithinibacillus caprae]
MASNKDKLPSKFDIDMTPLHDFMRQMDSFFNHSFKHINSQFNLRPFWVDVRETDSKFIVEAELPGYKRDQIELEIIGNQLRIGVEDHAVIEEKNNEDTYFNKQQSYQKRERFVTLPFEIPKRETKASFRDGLLKVTIPKRHSERKYLDIHE